ncbi:kinase A anchor protein [Lasiosphaeria hispida]|uniref:Kinase A anchor protein n=1 Tax=Lasiosphaeria hispida TaxID=260671 RepID=A0AAJ0M975_9PEZI|nr:kinase A anchor protein [Lasiosphaeria hispida]
MPPKPAAPTHFLCIPLVNAASRPQLAQSLSAFRADVSSPASFGVPEDAVRPVGTLHLTLGVFSFPKDEGLDRASELLSSLRLREMLANIKPPTMPGASEPEPAATAAETKGKGEFTSETPPEAALAITLRGLESMQLPEKASVLYAPPVDGLGTLYAFCERLRAAFQEAELMADEKRPLLLHATILNTIYVKGGRGPRGRGGKHGKRGEKLTIDARGILDRYDDQIWMEDVRVDKIAICRMGAKKTEVDGAEDEAYEVEAEVEF